MCDGRSIGEKKATDRGLPSSWRSQGTRTVSERKFKGRNSPRYVKRMTPSLEPQPLNTDSLCDASQRQSRVRSIRHSARWHIMTGIPLDLNQV